MYNDMITQNVKLMDENLKRLKKIELWYIMFQENLNKQYVIGVVVQHIRLKIIEND